MYVDDCHEDSGEVRLSITDELTLGLENGGFMLKGITYSGEKPPEH